MLFRVVQEQAKRQRIYTLPRIHIPPPVTRGLSDDDDIFTIGEPEYQGDEPNTHNSREPSLSTSYNATYRTDTIPRAPDDFLPFFESLEQQTRLNGGRIPAQRSADMLGTLNSLPPDLAPAPDAFSDARDLDEIEFVTEMLDDMTKDDLLDDDFIEAMNPNVAIPRASPSLQNESQSSGWFSVRFSNLISSSFYPSLFFLSEIYQLVNIDSSVLIRAN